jgi:hypothetical protein
MTLATVERVAAALDARLLARLLWRGEELDRLLDGEHTTLIDQVIRLLVVWGWTCLPEATFNIYGERGSVDVLAFHAQTSILLVIEVKSLIPDIGPMLMTLDRKRRVARDLARERGWKPVSVARLLVIREGPTARRHAANHRQTLEAALPIRGVAVSSWLKRPVGAISGLYFLSNAHHASTIQRTRIRPKRPELGATEHSSQMAPTVTSEHDRLDKARSAHV